MNGRNASTAVGCIRIAVLNDYSMTEALRLVKQGQYPAHHTWGASHFERLGSKAIVPAFRGAGLWGSLRTQIQVYWRQREIDVVYAACQSETWLLARLRYLGLFRCPIVAVIHHPIQGRLRGGRMFVKGHDRLLFLSQRACEDALDDWPDVKRQSEVISWGVDLDFYDQQDHWPHPYGQAYFVSAGKANRDHQTLVDCAGAGQHKTLIVCSADTRPSVIDADWVTVVGDRSGHALTYGQLTSVYRSARAIVIPLAHVVGLAGLTSLLDAIACGRPVIMTRNALIDVDIEALGFGVWVPVGDREALGQAMRRLADDDELVTAMGAKARAFAEQQYLYETFSKQVLAHCANALRVAKPVMEHG